MLKLQYRYYVYVKVIWLSRRRQSYWLLPF